SDKELALRVRTTTSRSRLSRARAGISDRSLAVGPRTLALHRRVRETERRRSRDRSLGPDRGFLAMRSGLLPHRDSRRQPFQRTAQPKLAPGIARVKQV